MQNAQIFNKILVPTDGSLSAIVAQELAAVIAKEFNSEVTVLHVVSHGLMSFQLGKPYPEFYKEVPLGTGTGGPELDIPASPPSGAQEEVSKELTVYYREKGTEIISDAVSLFEEEDIPVSQELIEHSDPAEAIMKKAEGGNFDLIVMGYAGEEEGRKPHLGSVTKKVSLHAKTPVLIVREKRRITKILVPVDGSENAKRALNYAEILGKRSNAKITLLYVQDPSLVRLRPKLAEAMGTRILSEAADKISEMTPDRKLESGDPAEAILQIAKNGDYDLIAIGSKGHSAVARFLLGSVSDHIVTYADCPVLLIK